MPPLPSSPVLPRADCPPFPDHNEISQASRCFHALGLTWNSFSHFIYRATSHFSCDSRFLPGGSSQLCLGSSASCSTCLPVSLTLWKVHKHIIFVFLRITRTQESHAHAGHNEVLRIYHMLGRESKEKLGPQYGTKSVIHSVPFIVEQVGYACSLCVVPRHLTLKKG